jgi:hypothetical protein
MREINRTQVKRNIIILKACLKASCRPVLSSVKLLVQTSVKVSNVRSLRYSVFGKKGLSQCKLHTPSALSGIK